MGSERKNMAAENQKLKDAQKKLEAEKLEFEKQKKEAEKTDKQKENKENKKPEAAEKDSDKTREDNLKRMKEEQRLRELKEINEKPEDITNKALDDIIASDKLPTTPVSFEVQFTSFKENSNSQKLAEYMVALSKTKSAKMKAKFLGKAQ